MKLDMKDFDKESAYQIMKKLCIDYSPRVTGSKNEQDAIKFISRCFRKNIGSLPMVESFPIKFYEGKYASIQLFPSQAILEGSPMWMTINTPSTGVEADISFIQLSKIEKPSSSQIKDKIVILHTEEDYLKPENFRRIKAIFAQKPIGVVILTKNQEEVVRSDIFFGESSIFKNIPTMILPEKEFKAFEEEDPIEGKLLIHGETDYEAVTSNISTIIQGLKNDFILICAHHDTVENTQGARDSAAGVALILELARLISKQTPNYTYRIVSLGGEKTGLEGISQLLKEYDASRVLLSINFDRIDSIPGEIQTFVLGDDQLYEMVNDISETTSFEAQSKHKTPNRGNNMVLAKNNIPSIMHTIKGDKDKMLHHTELDSIDTFTPISLEKMGEYAISIINRLEQMEEIEFTNNIPNDLLKETEEFFEKLKLHQS